MNPAEYIRGLESFRSSEGAGAPTTQLQRQQALRMFEERSAMINSIDADISTSLLEALHKKIAYEQRSLNTLIEADEKRELVEKKRNKVLNSQFFVQKRLDVNLL